MERYGDLEIWVASPGRMCFNIRGSIQTNGGDTNYMTDTTKNLALDIASVALDRKAKDLLLLDVRAKVDYTDYLIICSGRSTRQVGAISDHIEETLGKAGVSPLGVEGRQTRKWILMDYGDVVVHIFQEETRELYALEKLWFDAPRVEVPEPAQSAAVAAAP